MWPANLTAPAGMARSPTRAAFGVAAVTFPAMEFSRNNHIPPRRGGDPQGRQDSNLRRAVLEAAVLAAELRPYEIRNRPPGPGSWGRCLRIRDVRVYIGTCFPYPRSIRCEKAS